MIGTVLITGANGMLGRVLVSRLIKQKLNVVACVRPGNYNSFKKLNESLLTIVEVDINNHQWENTLQNVTYVVHLAAKVHVHDKKELKWEDFYQTNVVATKKLCKYVLKSNVKRFIFLSTVGVHGDYPELNNNGQLLIKPSNYYSKSKLLAEEEIKKELFDKISFVILRPAMIYGPGDKGNMGRLIKAIKNRRFVIPGSGFNKKNAIYVEDMVEIIYRMLLRHDINNQTFLISNRNVITFREMCEEISKKLGYSGRIPSIPVHILNILSLIEHVLPQFPINKDTIRKLTIDSDFSGYSNIQDILKINEETTFKESLKHIDA